MALVMDPDRQAAEDALVALGNTDIVTTSWRADLPPVPDGVVGGDGAGESMSVRYSNRYLPNARMTAYFYVVDLRERGDDFDPVFPFMVEEMVEFLLTDGPLFCDADSVFCDYEYESSTTAYATEGEALVERDRWVGADSADNHRWDGKPFNL